MGDQIRNERRTHVQASWRLALQAGVPPTTTPTPARMLRAPPRLDPPLTLQEAAMVRLCGCHGVRGANTATKEPPIEAASSPEHRSGPQYPLCFPAYGLQRSESPIPS